MRTVPGVKFTPSLDLPRRADGATELVLAASRQPVSLTGGIADLGTGMQPLVNMATNSLTPLGEQVKLTAAVPFNTDDVKYFNGEIRVPIGADGLALKIDGYHYDARPEDDAIEYLGFERRVKNDRVGLGVSYPFLLNNSRSLTGTLGVYAANSKDRYDARNSDRWLQQDARVRAANAELRYIQVSESQATDITLGVAKGFDAAGAKKTSQPITAIPPPRSWTWISPAITSTPSRPLRCRASSGWFSRAPGNIPAISCLPRSRSRTAAGATPWAIPRENKAGIKA